MKTSYRSDLNKYRLVIILFIRGHNYLNIKTNESIIDDVQNTASKIKINIA